MTRSSPPSSEWDRTPQLWRGAARDWPALPRWAFAHLGTLAPHQTVQVVQGNRKIDAAHLVNTTWGEHLARLDQDPRTTHVP